MGLIARLRDLALRTVGEIPLVGSASVLPELPLWQQYSRIGGNITPAQVSSILQQADGGSITQLVDLANEARQKDGHLHSVLATRENALTQLELMIDPTIEHGEDEPSEQSLMAADLVRYALSCAAGDDQSVRSLADTLAHLNGGVYHGHATSEIVWAVKDGLMVPAGFRPVDQRRFCFSLSDGRLRFSDTYRPSAEIDLRTIWPGKFIQHQPRINGDVPAREGLSRLLLWAALFRNWSTGDWLKLAELSWKPWRIGIYSFKAGDKDKSELMQALQRLTTNGVITHREDHRIDLRWAGSTSSSSSSAGMGPHERLCDFMSREMSKAVLGQTLTVEPGSRGARSLGEVHDRVRRDIQEQDARSVADTIRRDLVTWIVRLNLGDDVPIPGVRFATDDTADVESFSNGIRNLAQAGVQLSQPWVHDMIGHPQIDDSTVLIGADVEDDAPLEDMPQD